MDLFHPKHRTKRIASYAAELDACEIALARAEHAEATYPDRATRLTRIAVEKVWRNAAHNYSFVLTGDRRPYMREFDPALPARTQIEKDRERAARTVL
jgi:hypothetical protein